MADIGLRATPPESLLAAAKEKLRDLADPTVVVIGASITDDEACALLAALDTRDLVVAALRQAVDGSSEPAWLIHFEDADRPVEVFVGAGAEAAARSRSELVGQSWTHTLFSSLAPDEYVDALRADLERSYVALGGLQRDVERECAKSRPSRQRLREAIDRSDLSRAGRWDPYEGQQSSVKRNLDRGE